MNEYIPNSVPFDSHIYPHPSIKELQFTVNFAHGVKESTPMDIRGILEDFRNLDSDDTLKMLVFIDEDRAHDADMPLNISYSSCSQSHGILSAPFETVAYSFQNIVQISINKKASPQIYIDVSTIDSPTLYEFYGGCLSL